MELSKRQLVLLAAVALSACRAEGNGERLSAPDALGQGAASLRLEPVDTTYLEESKENYIGKIAAFGVAPDGGYLVADAFRPRVVRYSKQGKPLTTYGSPGQGPGELQTPASIATSGDSLLIVADARDGQLEIYDLQSTEYRRTIATDFFVRSPVVQGDSVLVSGASTARRMSLAKLPLRGTGAPNHMLVWPPEYAESPLMPQRYANAIFGVWGDTVLATLAGTPVWYVMDVRGRVTDTIAVPAVRRRGFPLDFVKRLKAIRNQEEQFQLSSLPFSVHRLSSGEVAIVHVEPRLISLNVLMDGYVSVLSADLKRACVDAPLNFSQDGQVRVAWRGDTLLVAEQVTSGDAVRVSLRSMLLNRSGCEWIETWSSSPYTDWAPGRRADSE